MVARVLSLRAPRGCFSSSCAAAKPARQAGRRFHARPPEAFHGCLTAAGAVQGCPGGRRYPRGPHREGAEVQGWPLIRETRAFCTPVRVAFRCICLNALSILRYGGHTSRLRAGHQTNVRPVFAWQVMQESPAKHASNMADPKVAQSTGSRESLGKVAPKSHTEA